VTGETLVVKSPWPKKLLVALKFLREYDKSEIAPQPPVGTTEPGN